MSVKKFKNLHDGKRGAALGVRVVPRASKNELVEILNDGTVKIRLIASPDSTDLDAELLKFLSEILEVSQSNMEIIVGGGRLSKLISILNIDSDTCQERILKHLP